ncbi:hypothetical protein Tco_1131069 [Tanacetum coccineum]
MASAIIYLAINQKFNFSKYIFESMVKNLHNENKFLMYPRFVLVFLDKQVGDMSTHDKIYVTPSHTKKVFGNMKKVGKGFSRDVTPLFPTMMVQAHEEMGKGLANPTDPHHTPTIIQPSTSQPQKKQKPRKPKRKDTEIPQSSGLTEPRADEAANEENVPTHSNDPLLSGEDRLKLEELMALCTNLQNRVLVLEHTKTTQALEIESLKRRVKKLEKKQRLKPHKLKRLYKVGLSAKVISSDDASLGEEDASKQGRINAIDADEDIYLVKVPIDEDMFGVNDLEGDEVVVESDVAAKKKDDEVNVVEEVVSTVGDAAPVSAATITTVELTLAQTLAELKSARSKAKGLVIPEQEPSESIKTTTTKTTAGILLQEPSETRTTTTPTIPLKDKGKGIMVEEPLKMKKKDQVLFDQQEAIRLQAQFDKEERIAREKEEANAALITQWNDIQDKAKTEYELAQRLQAEEQEEFTDAEKATLFVQHLEKRRKQIAAKRAEEKRNRPPTKAQQWSIMCTHLKNMAGWKPKDLKNKSFATIQDLFDKDMKRTREESSSKRVRDELESDKSKKKKLYENVEAEVDDAKEAEELKQCLEIVSDDGDDVTIDVTPLSVKILIVDYKIHQEGKKRFFRIIRADGNSQMYLTFTKMLKNIDRDLEVLWKIVKARFKRTEPVNYMDNFLLLNLKTMFEHHVEDGSIPYYLLVEKMYPLTKHTLHQMFNDVKLQVDYECGMAYELLRLVKKQLKEGYVPE